MRFFSTRLVVTVSAGSSVFAYPAWPLSQRCDRNGTPKSIPTCHRCRRKGIVPEIRCRGFRQPEMLSYEPVPLEPSFCKRWRDFSGIRKSFKHQFGLFFPCMLLSTNSSRSQQRATNARRIRMLNGYAASQSNTTGSCYVKW